MSDLLWWGGIGGDTSIRQIGWTYVVLAVCISVFLFALVKLYRIWKP